VNVIEEDRTIWKVSGAINNNKVFRGTCSLDGDVHLGKPSPL
jgi:hypothetical protein